MYFYPFIFCNCFILVWVQVDPEPVTLGMTGGTHPGWELFTHGNNLVVLDMGGNGRTQNKPSGHKENVKIYTDRTSS